MRNLFSALVLFVSLNAAAWRETNNGGGITEQNLVYLQQNMFNLLEPLQQKNIGFEDFAKFIS